MKLTLAWRWFAGLATLLVVLLLVINLAIDLSLPSFLVRRIRQDMERQAWLAREAFAPKLAQTGRGDINEFAHELARHTGLRFTVITPDGTVIAESDKPQAELAQIENHLYRPEVQAAKQSGVGTATRHSDTIGMDLMYVAVAANGSGFVRVALPLYEIEHTKARVRRTVGWASVIVILAALPVVMWLARRLTVPIEGMRQMAGRVTAGDFSVRAPEEGGPELQQLGGALNQMSSQLETRLRELASEKADLNTTLSNMVEGVLVVDAKGKIRLANDALRQQFNLTETALGKTVMEVIRNAGLQDLITEALGAGQIRGRELPFLVPEERFFDVNATVLRAQGETVAGAVVVLHDITRIKRLENIRKEFVANVSHELRTPLAIIKGYVETLQDEPAPDPASSQQFLQTIQKHSRRLEALIEDLLSISALESQQARLNFDAIPLTAAAATVVDELAAQAGEKSITVVVEIPADLPTVRADDHRLHQVFFNLLDNAVKYTGTGGRVILTAKASGDMIEVCVADNGPGIAPEHLPHVFERFYRVDKARSRELGGTGLGLSIVKHIIQAHGGRVWAESELEKGSRFYFTVPRAQA